MTMTEDSLEEAIPIVTIHSPNELPSSPTTYLVRSSSLVTLTKSPPSIRVFQTDDPNSPLSKLFSVSTNALNRQTSFELSNKLNHSINHHHYSESEIYLNPKLDHDDDLNYDQLNLKLIETLDFGSIGNHCDSKTIAPIRTPSPFITSFTPTE